MTDKECEIETSKAIMEMRKYIAELKEENAELKEENSELKQQCSILADCNTCYSSCKNENVEMKKQLTKAKEYIKLLLMNCVGVYESTGKTIAEIQIEAEQFLNSDIE